MANKHGRVKLASKEPHFPPKKKKTTLLREKGQPKRKTYTRTPVLHIHDTPKGERSAKIQSTPNNLTILEQ